MCERFSGDWLHTHQFHLLLLYISHTRWFEPVDRPLILAWKIPSFKVSSSRILIEKNVTDASIYPTILWSLSSKTVILLCGLPSVLIFSPLLHPLWHIILWHALYVRGCWTFQQISLRVLRSLLYISAAHFKVKERVRELPCLSSLTTLLRISIWHLRQSRNGERDISHHVSNVVLGWREGNYRESEQIQSKRIDFCVRDTPFFLQPPSSSYICWYLVTLTVMDIWFLIDFLTVQLEIQDDTIPRIVPRYRIPAAQVI